jgi:hypothetical protein
VAQIDRLQVRQCRTSWKKTLEREKKEKEKRKS